MLRNREKFGEIIVRKGIATREKIEEALAIQREQLDKGMQPQKIGEILESMGLITKEQIEDALNEQKKFYLRNWIYSIFNIYR